MNNANTISQEDWKLFQSLKAEAQKKMALRKESYLNRKMVRETYKQYFLSHASTKEKQDLENKLA